MIKYDLDVQGGELVQGGLRLGLDHALLAGRAPAADNGAAPVMTLDGVSEGVYDLMNSLGLFDVDDGPLYLNLIGDACRVPFESARQRGSALHEALRPRGRSVIRGVAAPSDESWWPTPAPFRVMIAVGLTAAELHNPARRPFELAHLNAIARSFGPAGGSVQPVFTTSLADLREALISCQPSLVHVVAHGKPGWVKLGEDWVLAQEFGSAVAGFSPRAAVLSVCRATGDTWADGTTLSLADALIEAGVAVVIASPIAVDVEAITLFAGEFYGALARGASIDEAIRLGRLSMLPIDLVHSLSLRVHSRTTNLQSGAGTMSTAWNALRPPFDSATSSSSGDTLSKLDPERRAVQFVGRDDEMKRFERWLENGDALDLALITGVGGSGKTRLAVEMLRSAVGLGWTTGWLRDDISDMNLDHHEEQLRRLLLIPRLCLAIEEGESRVGVLEFLVGEAQSANEGRIRLLVTSRTSNQFSRRRGAWHPEVRDLVNRNLRKHFETNFTDIDALREVRQAVLDALGAVGTPSPEAHLDDTPLSLCYAALGSGGGEGRIVNQQVRFWNRFKPLHVGNTDTTQLMAVWSAAAPWLSPLDRERAVQLLTETHVCCDRAVAFACWQWVLERVADRRGRLFPVDGPGELFLAESFSDVYLFDRVIGSLHATEIVTFHERLLRAAHAGHILQGSPLYDRLPDSFNAIRLAVDKIAALRATSTSGDGWFLIEGAPQVEETDGRF